MVRTAALRLVAPARARSGLLLLVALVVAVGLVAGPSAGAADARARCRSGYHLKKKRGVLRCVRKPKEPERPRDAVTPSSIELIVGVLKEGEFGATGFMRFPQRVTGTAYGEWVIANGVARERVPFTLRNITDTDYSSFTIGYPIRVHITGRTVTARLVIGRVSSNSIALKQ